MTSLLLKKRIKAHIDIDIKSIEGLSKRLKNQNIKLEYKRGTGLSGESQLYKVIGKSLDLNYNINFDVSLFYSENKKKEKKFQPKKIVIYVIVDNQGLKKPLKIGKLEYDLANVATPGAFEPNQTLHMKGKDRNYKHMKLNVHFKTEWLKVDGKKLIKRSKKPKYDASDSSIKSEKKKVSSKEDLPHDLYDDLPDFSEDMSGSYNDTLTVEGEKYDLVTDLDHSEVNEDSEWVGEDSEVDFLTDDEVFVEDHENIESSKPKDDSTSHDILTNEEYTPKYEEDTSSVRSEDLDTSKNREDSNGFKLREKSRLLESSSQQSFHSDTLSFSENKSSPLITDIPQEESYESSHPTSSEEKKKKKKKPKSERIFQGTDSEDNIKQYVESKDELISILQEKVKFLESELSKKKNSKREKKSSDSRVKSLEAKIQSLKKENESLTAIIQEKDNEIARIKEKEKGINDEDMKEKIEELDYQLYNWELLVNFFYNALWTYDRNNENEYAEELSNIISETGVLENSSKYDEKVADLLRKLLVCLFKRAKTLESNSLYDLIGLFKWSITLLTGILKKSTISDELKPDSHITWANDINKNGIILRIDGLLDGKEVLDTYNVEKEFASKIEEDGIAIAFADILDTFLSVVYVLIITTFQSKFDESKIIDLYFTQTIQKNTKPIKSKVPFAYIIYQLEKLLHYLREHRIEESIQVQILAQFFHWNSVIVVNSLINIAEYCKASCGLSIKMACSHIEQWLFNKISRDRLSYIEETLIPMKEAANVLTIDKNSFDDESLLDNVFIHLNVAQIYQILEQFISDEFSPDKIPNSTLENLKSIVRNSNAKVTHFEVNLINY